MDYQIWIAFSDVMLLVFQLNHFLAFVSDFGESKPDLHSAVIHILRKSRTQGLINIFSNFSNCGCLVTHSRLPCGWSHFIAGHRRRSISVARYSTRPEIPVLRMPNRYQLPTVADLF